MVAVARVAVSGCAARESELRLAVRQAGRADGHASTTPTRRRREPAPLSGVHARRSARCSRRPTPKNSLLPTIESSNPALARALLLLAMHESSRDSSAGRRRVPERAGVLDYAYRHYQRAAVLEPCDAVSYDGMARLWRDWGMPDLGLERCLSRAALQSEVGGDLQHARHDSRGARAAGRRARGPTRARVALDPRAAFALNNLCYLELDAGQTGRGAASARRRWRSIPTSRPRATTSRSSRRRAAISRGAEAAAASRRRSGTRALQRRHPASERRPLSPKPPRRSIRPPPPQPSLDHRAPAIRAGATGRASGGAATMITAERPRRSSCRRRRSLEEAGLSLDLITQLVLKTLHFSGELTGTELARRLGLPFHVIEPVVAASKQQHHVEISAARSAATSYRYRITDAGRTRAMLFLEQNHYVGVAPVPLAQYRALHGGVQGRGAAPGRRATACARRSRTW